MTDEASMLRQKCQELQAENQMLKQPAIHPSIASVMRFFKSGHLPPHLASVSELCAELAAAMAARGTGPELTVGLRKLLEAKDCFVRAAIDAHERDTQQLAEQTKA